MTTYTLTKETGSLSAGIVTAPNCVERRVFDSFEEAHNAFLETKENTFVCGSPDYEGTLTEVDKIVYFVQRGWGISDCSEYHRLTLSWE